jgi:cobalt-precorrin 5A hydrolase
VEGREAVIAAGLGCRKGCDRADVLRALEAALASTGRTLEEIAALYAPDFKTDEPSLRGVARELGKLLVFIPTDQLQVQAAFALTRSDRALAEVGLPSVAETAALAGAAALDADNPAPVKLLGPRQIAGGATCALAIRNPTDALDPRGSK